MLSCSASSASAIQQVATSGFERRTTLAITGRNCSPAARALPLPCSRQPRLARSRRQAQVSWTLHSHLLLLLLLDTQPAQNPAHHPPRLPFCCAAPPSVLRALGLRAQQQRAAAAAPWPHCCLPSLQPH
eukprot:scaffold64994_cov19-Tisochrysis_lutea.AAC.5